MLGDWVKGSLRYPQKCPLQSRRVWIGFNKEPLKSDSNSLLNITMCFCLQLTFQFNCAYLVLIKRFFLLYYIVWESWLVTKLLASWRNVPVLWEDVGYNVIWDWRLIFCLESNIRTVRGPQSTNLQVAGLQLHFDCNTPSSGGKKHFLI